MVSSAFVSHIFALQSLFQDQDVLFGPHEVQFTAIAEANLKRKEDELAHTRVVLTYEKEQRALTEAALNAKVLEAEKVRDSSLQAMTAAQSEVSNLKRDNAGGFSFLCIFAFSALFFLSFSEFFVCFPFSSC